MHEAVTLITKEFSASDYAFVDIKHYKHTEVNGLLKKKGKKAKVFVCVYRLFLSFNLMQMSFLESTS